MNGLLVVTAAGAGSDEDDSNDNEDDELALPSDGEDYITLSGLDLQWPDAPYHWPGPGQRTISVNAQPEEFQLILRRIFYCVEGDAMFESFYISVDELTNYIVGTAILNLAAYYNLNNYVRWLRRDVTLKQECVHIVSLFFFCPCEILSSSLGQCSLLGQPLNYLLKA